MGTLTALVQKAECMMISANEQETGIAVQFADGAKGLVPFSDIAEVAGDLADIQLPNPYELLLRDGQGREIDVGWDFVRHYCDPRHAAREEREALEGQQALGSRIRRLRKERSLTQEEAASKAGIARGTLVRVEKGEQMPDYRTLLGLSNAFGVKLADLVAPESE